MTDPWADVRDRTSKDERRFEESGGHGGHIGAHKDRKRLLTDADALLEAVKAAQEVYDTHPVAHPSLGRLGAHLAALPEHLR